MDIQGAASGIIGGSISGEMIRMIILITVLSIAPAILLTTTCFIRFVVAFSFLRTGLGLQSTPANMIIIALSLFMTSFVMAPSFERAWRDGVIPLTEKRIDEQEALRLIMNPLRDFMLAHVRDKDLDLFIWMTANDAAQQDRELVSIRALIPAFMISELRRGFEIGLLLILPFLIIDLVVATIVMSMGMMMMPPFVISLPVKVLFFVPWIHARSATRFSSCVNSS
jgi:flagellar biosynthesis protein FliP